MLTNIKCLYCTSWLPMLRYGESVFTKEIQGTEFFVVVALLCKFWSISKLCIYIYIFARDVCIECVLLKKGKNSLSHERYSFKYTLSDKPNGL